MNYGFTRLAARNAKTIMERVKWSSVNRGVCNNPLLLPHRRGAPYITNGVRSVNMADCFRQSYCSQRITGKSNTTDDLKDKPHLSELSLMGWYRDFKDWIEDHGDKVFATYEKLPDALKQKVKFGTEFPEFLFENRVKIRSYAVEDAIELILNCGGFQAKDVHVEISGRLIHITGDTKCAGLELQLDRQYKIYPWVWFNTMEAKAYVQRGCLMIRLPKSGTKTRKNLKLRVDVVDIE